MRLPGSLEFKEGLQNWRSNLLKLKTSYVLYLPLGHLKRQHHTPLSFPSEGIASPRSCHSALCKHTLKAKATIPGPLWLSSLSQLGPCSLSSQIRASETTGRGWRDGSAAKTCFSSRGPRCHSQHPHQMVHYHLESRRQWIQWFFWSLELPTHVAHRHIYINENKINIFSKDTTGPS